MLSIVTFTVNHEITHSSSFRRCQNVSLPDKAKCTRIKCVSNSTMGLQIHFPSHSKVHFLTFSVSVAGAI